MMTSAQPSAECGTQASAPRQPHAGTRWSTDRAGEVWGLARGCTWAQRTETRGTWLRWAPVPPGVPALQLRASRDLTDRPQQETGPFTQTQPSLWPKVARARQRKASARAGILVIAQPIPPWASVPSPVSWGTRGTTDAKHPAHLLGAQPIRPSWSVPGWDHARPADISPQAPHGLSQQERGGVGGGGKKRAGGTSRPSVPKPGAT